MSFFACRRTGHRRHPFPSRVIRASEYSRMIGRNADKAALPSLFSRLGHWRMPCAFFATCRDIRGDAAFRHCHFRNCITRIWAEGYRHPSKHSPRSDHLSRGFQCGIVILAQQCVVARHSLQFMTVVHAFITRLN